MPRKRLAMRHIGEVLRLAAQGLSQCEISSSLGISRTSVRNYVARAERAGLRWPLPEHLDAEIRTCISATLDAPKSCSNDCTPGEPSYPVPISPGGARFEQQRVIVRRLQAESTIRHQRPLSLPTGFPIPDSAASCSVLSSPKRRSINARTSCVLSQKCR